MNNNSNSNISTTTSSSSSSSSSMVFADRVLAPAGVTLLLLLVLVVAYVFARRQKSVGVQFDEMATAAAAVSGNEDEIDEDEYFGVNEETVKSFPKLVYSQRLRGETAVEEGEDSGTCSICLLEYKESDVIRMLPVCNHFFHQSCVDQWLKLHSTCPICRISLLRSTRRFRVIT